MSRFFMDHGMIHDRVSGQHIHTDPDIEPGAQQRLFDLLQALERGHVHSFERALHGERLVCRCGATPALAFDVVALKANILGDPDDEPSAGFECPSPVHSISEI